MVGAREERVNTDLEGNSDRHHCCESPPAYSRERRRRRPCSFVVWITTVNRVEWRHRIQLRSQGHWLPRPRQGLPESSVPRSRRGPDQIRSEWPIGLNGQRQE